MPSAASPAPPLSVRGTLAAIRAPTRRDLLFCAKTTLAAIACLLVAFRENLDNPYWSALTVFVLTAQPEAGAVRSKAIFRIVGTLLGGAAAVALAAVFASSVGFLLAATIGAIVLVTWLKGLDRTPVSYTWFVTALTLAVVGLAQVEAPETIFPFAVTRMVEIGLAVLMIGLVDSLIFPSAATPEFLRSMADWRDHIANWTAATLDRSAPLSAADREQQRLDLHRIAGLLGPLDAQGVQLPYDIVAKPPRARDLRLIRLTVAHLVTHLAASDLWTAGAFDGAPDAAFAELLRETRRWIVARAPFDANCVRDHAVAGLTLRDRLQAWGGADLADGAGRRGAAAIELARLVDHWVRLEQTLHALASGSPLPREVNALARRARPVRSIDYLLGLVDAAPMALALGVIAVLWFATTWTSAISAMLFAFIALGFVGGTPAALRSARGIIVWIAITCAIALVYQFAILPRVTAFPVLIAVLLLGIAPLSLLMTMSPAGLLIIANGLALIGLQSVYAADFGGSLENLAGAIVGCVAAAGALYLLQFDRPRFIASRLVAALRRDLRDVAVARRAAPFDRLVSLSVDRVVLYGSALAATPGSDDVRGGDLLGILRVAVDLAWLRRNEATFSATVRDGITRLCTAIGDSVGRGVEPNRPALADLTCALRAALRDEPETQARTGALASLVNLAESLGVSLVGRAPAMGRLP